MRKCEVCMHDITGVCPFDFACKLSVFAQFRRRKLEMKRLNSITIFVPMSEVGGG